MTKTAAAAYTFTSFRFFVELGNVHEAGFTECSGLQAEVQVEEYLQGGENDTVRKLPGRAKYANITLRRGVCYSDELWKWWKKILQGQLSRKNVTIVLCDQAGNPKSRWTLVDAFPVKWVAPQLRAGENSAAIETLEFTYQRLDIQE